LDGSKTRNQLSLAREGGGGGKKEELDWMVQNKEADKSFKGSIYFC